VLIESRSVKLTTRTGIAVNRTIPHRNLRTIGAWCFVDHFGPTPQTDGMVVAAHPHTGLQTVTWLFEGEIEHRDSIGSIQSIRPGQLNLMTAGRGISHSELSMATTDNLHAVQLWVAIPEESIDAVPAFEHHAELPKVDTDKLQATVLIGDFMGSHSSATTFSDMVGVELVIGPGGHRVELRGDYEYGFMLVSGDLQVGEQVPSVSNLVYLEPGNDSVELVSVQGATLMLIGGVPLSEKILMWWNFIGRTHMDVAVAREDWNSRSARFGAFEDKIGGWIPAPDLPGIQLKAR